MGKGAETEFPEVRANTGVVWGIEDVGWMEQLKTLNTDDTRANSSIVVDSRRTLVEGEVRTGRYDQSFYLIKYSQFLSYNKTPVVISLHLVAHL